MNKSLLDEVKGVSVDLTYMGFTLTPDVPSAQAVELALREAGAVATWRHRIGPETA